MSTNFKIKETSLEGAFLFERTTHLDERGAFEKIFCLEEMKEIWGERKIQQSNISFSSKIGTIRGLHCQFGEYSEAKIVTCIKGSIFDVLLDLRPASATFGRWLAFELTAKNKKAIFIPEGFAHGFQTLENDVIVNYIHSAQYRKAYEGGINVFDKSLNIGWPIKNFILSERDQALPNLKKSMELEHEM